MTDNRTFIFQLINGTSTWKSLDELNNNRIIFYRCLDIDENERKFAIKRLKDHLPSSIFDINLEQETIHFTGETKEAADAYAAQIIDMALDIKNKGFWWGNNTLPRYALEQLYGIKDLFFGDTAQTTIMRPIDLPSLLHSVHNLPPFTSRFGNIVLIDDYDLSILDEN